LAIEKNIKQNICMIPEFDGLREDEIEHLLKAPIYVAVLISGADGMIDDKERKEAVSAAKSKQMRAREKLVVYYKEVAVDFELKMVKMIKELPHDKDERNSDITIELKKLNKILPKVEKVWAIQFVASLKDLAKRIAEASGGVLGYMTVSYDEAKLVELKMIEDPSK
jgi:hypothetical protein